MKRLFLILFLFAFSAPAATTFTEFYVQTTGDNLNAGSTTSDSALVTLTAGDWVAATGVYTKAASDLSAITVGMWASVYNDGATLAVFVGRITAVDDGADTITVSLLAKSGTAPTDGTGDRSIKIGGAWDGPSGAVGFPFGFVQSTMTNLNSGVIQGHVPRINFKSGVAYAVTAAMTHANAGPIRWQGYTTTVGDLGKAEINGGTAGASYVVLATSGAGNDYVDFIFKNNGATATQLGVNFSGTRLNVLRCVFTGMRGLGAQANGTDNNYIECEFYANNTGNLAGAGGMSLGGLSRAIRCISHDNAGSNSSGFVVIQGNLFFCIADSNGAKGYNVTSTIGGMFVNCDSYNNVGDGMDFTAVTTATFYVENCNFIKNGGFGLQSSGSPIRSGAIFNCGFGSGTQANTSGSLGANLGGLNEVGTLTYAANVTPWVDPANGDFRINLAAAQYAGRGLFTETAPSYAGTISYPAIGAAQATNITVGGSSSGGSFTWVQ